MKLNLLVASAVLAKLVAAQGACMSSGSQCAHSVDASPYTTTCTCTGNSDFGDYFKIFLPVGGGECTWVARDATGAADCPFKVVVTDSGCNIQYAPEYGTKLTNVKNIECHAWVDTDGDFATPLPPST